MTFTDLYKKLSQLYPESLSEEWDNDGIMCAPYLTRNVSRALITLDVTDDAIEYAKSNDCFNVTLGVWTGNENAKGFYESLGFKPQKTYMELIIKE
jgi:GNAT superfamily N-acetyltransferase